MLRTRSPVMRRCEGGTNAARSPNALAALLPNYHLYHNFVAWHVQLCAMRRDETLGSTSGKRSKAVRAPRSRRLMRSASSLVSVGAVSV